MSTTFAIFLLAAMSAALPAYAEAPGDFAFGAPVETSGREALLRLELTPPVYEGVLRPDLSDLRVFNAAGEVVPHAFLPRMEDATAPPQALRVPLFPLRGAAAAGVEGLDVRVDQTGGRTRVTVRGRDGGSRDVALLGYLADLTALERPLQALLPVFSPRTGDVAAKLRVEGSDDLFSWTLLADGAPVLRLESGGQKLERTRVELAPRKVNYLRLSWPGSAPAPELAALAVELAQATPRAPRAWKSATAIAAEKPGEYAFDLGGRFPVDRLRLALPQANTVAAVQILARARPDDPWRPVASASVYRLVRDGVEVNSPDLTLATSADRYWLVRVDPRGGGLGSGAPGLAAGWLPHRLVFAARGAGPFQIVWGSRAAKPAVYPVEMLVPGYRREAGMDQSALPIGAARIGATRPLAGDAAIRERIDWKRWLLWSSLVLGVTALAWMAFRLAWQVSQPKG
jgi:hypothetical protein